MTLIVEEEEEVENQIKKMEEKKDDLEKQITDLSDQIKSMNTGNVAAPKVIDV